MYQFRASRSRRILVLMLVACAAGAALLTRVVYLQVIEHERLAAEAAAGLHFDTTLYGRRGAILDRNGDVLTTSVATWDLYVRARDWANPEVARAASEAIAIKLKVDAAPIRERVAAIGSGDVKIADDVDYEKGRLLIEASVPGLVALPNTRRVTPNGDLAASILGFVGRDNHGLMGIEESLNRVLEGRPGRVYYERDTTGDPIPYAPIVASEPEGGSDVILTIDRHLQRLAEETLDEGVHAHEAKGGTIIIMDPYSGDVLAMATSPRLKYSELDLDDPGATVVFKNAAVTDVYEPGSTMKVITAAAAIDAGVVTPDTTYHDSGSVRIYDTELRNWEDRAYGDRTMTGVLQHSINTGAVFMAQKLGVERQMEYFERFGFRSSTGIELSGEPTEAIYRRPEDPGWSPVDPATQSFGQSISVTPIQMIAAFAAVINGGNLVEPRLVRGYVRPDGTVRDAPVRVTGRAISEATSATMRWMLNQVVDPDDGSYSHPGNPRLYTAGGKSGTANVPITNGYQERHIASFIGFAPYENPRVVILVKLDENADLQTGTAAAAPYFARLVDDVLTYLNVDPNAGRLVERR
jgi:cell division protein FtsI (penicillin-binding protein 3)/stage V sporulation protein D (sporulation-specific penicillin-binding protein)